VAPQALRKFEDYLSIDRQLSPGTVKRHMVEIRKLFKHASFNPFEASRENIREYLKRFGSMSPYTYANVLKSLRIFYRDFLNRPEAVSGFRFPNRPFNPVRVPTRKDLQSFYKRLDKPLHKALFLLYATTGLRQHEVLSLRLRDIDLEKRMIIPNGGTSRTKRTWITFFNEEAEKALKEYLASFKGLDKDAKLFPVGSFCLRKAFMKFERETGVRIRPQILREWFSTEMARLGVPDRYVDAFSGRVPRSVLARHYTDYSPERLKEIYDKAGLKILED
jgi:integrase